MQHAVNARDLVAPFGAKLDAIETCRQNLPSSTMPPRTFLVHNHACNWLKISCLQEDILTAWRMVCCL